jgi:hypothetical protein
VDGWGGRHSAHSAASDWDSQVPHGPASGCITMNLSLFKISTLAKVAFFSNAAMETYRRLPAASEHDHAMMLVLEFKSKLE